MDELTEKEICRKYRDLKSTVELAKEYKVSAPTISAILKRNNEPIRTRSERQKTAVKTGRAQPLNREWNKTRRQNHSERIRRAYADMPKEKRESQRETARRSYEARSEEEKKKMTRLGAESSIRATKIGSKAERYIAAALKQNGYKVKFHAEGMFFGEKLQIDILLPTDKVCIEIDGPTHYSNIFGQDRLAKQMLSDQKKNGLIMDHGFVMIRVRNDAKNFNEHFGERMVKKLLNVLESIKENFPSRDNRFFHIEDSLE